ncbi:helix-turn-helix domain-containing protein [Streptomyces radiopugnans]|uniref:helix-turn-helix domain-containing protein n=1 Tax=Streptomyces radiopugnans TaxID=403935 RepID=UPI003F1ABA32
MFDVLHEVVEHVSWLIRARRPELRSRRHRLHCLHQALLTLVHLRTNAPLAEVAAGFGVSTATAGRYVTETVHLLAEHAPTLHAALRKLPPEGFVILEGLSNERPYLTFGGDRQSRGRWTGHRSEATGTRVATVVPRSRPTGRHLSVRGRRDSLGTSDVLLSTAER